MGFFNFLLIFLIALLMIVIVESIIQIVLFFATGCFYNSRHLILPSTLSIIIWSLCVVGFILTLNLYYDISVGTLLFNVLVTKSSIVEYLPKIFLSAVISSIIGIILQSFIYYTVNIPYSKISGSIRLKFKQLIDFKKKTELAPNAIQMPEEEPPLLLGTAFISSFFTFALIFFCIVILLSVGNILSSKVLEFIF